MSGRLARDGAQAQAIGPLNTELRRSPTAAWAAASDVLRSFLIAGPDVGDLHNGVALSSGLTTCLLSMQSECSQLASPLCFLARNVCTARLGG